MIFTSKSILASCFDSVGLFHSHLASPFQGEEHAYLPWREGLGEGDSPRSCFDERLPCFVGLRRSLASH